MKCLNCGGEFIPPQNINISFKTCPFCKASILDEETAKGFKNFADFLQYIVSVYSINIYKEKQKLANLISDLYTGEERLKRVYRRAVLDDTVSLRIYEISLKPLEERVLFYNQIMASFAEVNFYEQKFAEEVINTFAKGISLNLKREIDKLIEKAELGDVDAQANLGIYYYEGQDVDQNYKEAVKWLRKAAECGHIEAQYMLGIYYNYDCSEEEGGLNMKEAMRWFLKAAEQGHADALYQLGDYYYYGKDDYSEAEKYFLRAAEQGHDEAQFILGASIYDEVNDEEAVKWLRKAAEQGHDKAQFYLGSYYEDGIGVEKNISEAVKWCRKAAEQNHAEAQFCLGFYYEEGIGVEKNMLEAMKWYQKAAKQGEYRAKERLKQS